TKLVGLGLQNTNIQGDHFDLLPDSLKELDCFSCKKLSEKAIEKLQNKLALELLDVTGTLIAGDHFDLLPNSLKTFSCNDCKNVTDENLKKLKTKTKLEFLNISNTNIE